MSPESSLTSRCRPRDSGEGLLACMVEYRMEKTDITGPALLEEDVQGQFPTLPGSRDLNVFRFSDEEPEGLSSRSLKGYKGMLDPFHCSHHLQALSYTLARYSKFQSEPCGVRVLPKDWRRCATKSVLEKTRRFFLEPQRKTKPRSLAFTEE